MIANRRIFYPSAFLVLQTLNNSKADETRIYCKIIFQESLTRNYGCVKQLRFMKFLFGRVSSIHKLNQVKNVFVMTLKLPALILTNNAQVQKGMDMFSVFELLF